MQDETMAHSNNIIKDEPPEFGMIFDSDDTNGEVDAVLTVKQEELRSALAEALQFDKDKDKALQFAELNGTGAPSIPEQFEADVEPPGTCHFSSDNTEANAHALTRSASLARSRSRIEFSDDEIIATLSVTSKSLIAGQKRSDIMYPCNQCDQQFPYKSSLKIHQLKHIGKTSYVCDFCGKEYPNKYSLAIHISIHSAKKHSCYICSKQFSHKAYLKKHLPRHNHNALKKFVCEFCDKKFTLLDELKRHTVVHTDEKRYSCIECDKFFRNSSGLSLHREMFHTEIRPKCDKCDREFANKNSLHKHNKYIHKHTDSKGYTCEICDKFCKYRSSLDRHMSKHNGYPLKCVSCDKGFTFKYQLVRHERVHTGERPYQCDDCKHTFTKKESMMLHIVKRVCKKLKKKLFKCDICKTGFTSKQYLMKHMSKCEMKKKR